MEMISYREALAQRVINGIAVIAPKLNTLADDIRQLWAEFEALRPGETIFGCATKKEFCTQHLGRTPRAIRYLLAGGNHVRGEIVSPAPLQDATDADVGAFRLELEMFNACGRATGYVPTSLHDALMTRIEQFEALRAFVAAGSKEEVPTVVTAENTEKVWLWLKRAKLYFDYWDVLEPLSADAKNELAKLIAEERATLHATAL
jgi:hypothetical protein